MTHRCVCLALLVLGVGCALEKSPERACTQLGCGYIATFDVISTQDVPSLQRSWLRVCIAARCVSVAVPTLPGSSLARGAFTLRCDTVDAGGRYDVSAVIDQSPEVTGLMVGDIYTLSLTAADGALLVGKSWVATSYMENDPNGPDCGPHCWYADLAPMM